jgi:hypothetical protein
MKSVSAWKFSAPLSKVDLPRICDEAAEDSNDGYPIGVIKVTVDLGGGKSIVTVLADSDVVAEAVMFRDLPPPDSLLTEESRFRRVEGGVVSGPHLPTRSPEGLEGLLTGGRICVFKVATPHDADALIAKLVDRVVVNVEVF